MASPQPPKNPRRAEDLWSDYAEPTDGVRWPAGIGWPSNEKSNGAASPSTEESNGAASSSNGARESRKPASKAKRTTRTPASRAKS